ncbi:uroporphyrinogen-III synthase [Alkalicoccus chagannorensis]|uniref:uroporphyrinogen-III synthase n=1 Tax=Alkalicoccus chagannorensis TaxID=427072 RepID=UPI0003FC9E4E|nr:uroporphyrinogen-III synthase [Alkalicoccus chagannorensis]
MESLINTRAVHQQESLRRCIEAAGFESVDVPVTRTVFFKPEKPLPDADALILFTSVNAVKAFSSMTESRHWDTACVGAKTAAAASTAGFRVLFTPEEYRAGPFASAVSAAVPRRRRLFYPKSRIAGPVLENELARAGFQVDSAELYDTVAETSSRRALTAYAQTAAGICLMSPSAVLACFEMMPSPPAQLDFLCIGPVTAEALARYTGRTPFVPSTYTMEAMIDQYVQSR